MSRSGGLPLEGRVAVVTGGSSGIGRAIATTLAAAGADIALTYSRNAAGAEETARAIHRIGRKTMVQKLDLSDTAHAARALRDLADSIKSTLGAIHVWVNNAGADILTGESQHLSSEEKLDLLLAVDLRGTILASWEAARHLGANPGDASQSGGSIINMSWDHVIAGMPGRNPELFAAVKGGVLAFSKALARSVAPRVRVNIVAPGWIETAFAGDLADDRVEAIAAATPLRRWGLPADVAGAVNFLASSDASFITGQTIFVSGGLIMG